MRTALAVAVAALLAVVVTAALFTKRARSMRNRIQPINVGAPGNVLSPCPGTPNCVASQDAKGSQLMPPIPFKGRVEDAQARLREAIASMARGKVTVDRPGYVAVEFRSRLLGFVDDAEFVLDGKKGEIRFRSAARVGHSDLGMNRRRMNAIRKLFERGE